jgi:hypothetical protein
MMKVLSSTVLPFSSVIMSSLWQSAATLPTFHQVMVAKSSCYRADRRYGTRRRDIGFREAELHARHCWILTGEPAPGCRPWLGSTLEPPLALREVPFSRLTAQALKRLPQATHLGKPLQ